LDLDLREAGRKKILDGLLASRVTHSLVLAFLELRADQFYVVWVVFHSSMIGSESPVASRLAGGIVEIKGRTLVYRTARPNASAVPSITRCTVASQFCSRKF